MIKLLKRLFCKHKYIANGYVDQKIKNGIYKRQHIWKCKKCGKEKWGK